MEDIEVLEKELRNINNLIDYYTFENLDYDKKYRMERFKKAIETLLNELEKQDKVIDLMLEEITDCEFEMKCSECTYECEKDYDQLYQCNKEYFYKKVEG